MSALTDREVYDRAKALQETNFWKEITKTWGSSIWSAVYVVSFTHGLPCDYSAVTGIVNRYEDVTETPSGLSVTPPSEDKRTKAGVPV